MAITLAQWICLGFLFVMAIVAAVSIGCYNESIMAGVCAFIIGILVIVIILFGIHFYNTKTAAGARNYKDYQSNIHNGIERTLKIVADDGYVIYEREGKFDIEIHDDYIIFDENGERTIIYRSYTSSLVIEEVPN